MTIGGLLARVISSSLLCLALSGCFFVPGQFTAHLDLHRDGTFTYRYAGELVFVYPEETSAGEWDPAAVRCLQGPEDEPVPCSEDLLEQLRAQTIADRTLREQQAAEVADIFGYDPYDQAANEELARRLSGYDGWQAVTYKSPGVFDVVYEISGNLDHEMVFPVIPETQLSLPIVTVRRASGNLVEVEAPGMAPLRLQTLIRHINADFANADRLPLLGRARGTFTVTTDAELTDTNGSILTASSQRTVSWTVDGQMAEAPQAQFNLNR